MARGDDSPEHDLPGALHEVANALTVLLGWVQSAKDARHRGQNGEVDRALEVLESRARSAHRIARRAIGADGGGHPSPRPTGALVRDATVGLGPEARRAGVELRASVDADVELRLLAGGDHVVQVLTNLILNAIAASPKGGVITVTAASANREAVDADDVEITVTDEGPGVPEPLRGVLFEGGRSLRPGGAGIGLRHANDLAKSVGGALSLADTPRGARFSVRWPTCGIESVPPETRPLSRPSPLSGMRVLVVEDDEAVTELLDTALSARGAVVTSIRTHGELAGALRGGAFDVALFDISPIQDDPSGALEAVLEENPKAKLVLISGSTLSPPETRRGVHPAWVRKPFEIREIVDALLAE